MACFADINVLEGSVATQARCDRMFSIHLTANLLTKIIVNRSRFHRIIVKSLRPVFWSTLYIFILPQHGRSSTKYNKHNLPQNKQTQKGKLNYTFKQKSVNLLSNFVTYFWPQIAWHIKRKTLLTIFLTCIQYTHNYCLTLYVQQLRIPIQLGVPVAAGEGEAAAQ